VTISSLGTAGGTLVLAVATFSSVRSANRAARAAERSLLAGLRPVLIPSREDDPEERVTFGDGYRFHGAVLEQARSIHAKGGLGREGPSSPPSRIGQRVIAAQIPGTA
jgi:hypothetical protein